MIILLTIDVYVILEVIQKIDGNKPGGTVWCCSNLAIIYIQILIQIDIQSAIPKHMRRPCVDRETFVSLAIQQQVFLSQGNKKKLNPPGNHRFKIRPLIPPRR